ncbi:DUF4330 domain-containing protein [Syntrophomonas erecta]
MIDDKGRLFGIINIIDLVVLLLIVVVALGYFYRDRNADPAVTRTAEVKVICPYVRPEVAEQIKVGDQLVARGQVQPVKVTELRIETARDTDTRADGELILQKHPFRKDIYLTLEGPISNTGAELYLAGQQVRAGLDKFIVKTEIFEVQGEILEIKIKE